MSEDWVVHYRNRLLQLQRPSRPSIPAKSRVRVRENEARKLPFTIAITVCHSANGLLGQIFRLFWKPGHRGNPPLRRRREVRRRPP